MLIKHGNTVPLYFLALYITEVPCVYVSWCSSFLCVCMCGWTSSSNSVLWLIYSMPEWRRLNVQFDFYPSLPLSPLFIPSFLYISFIPCSSIHLSLIFMAASLSPSLLEHKIADIKSFALFITLFQCTNDFHILHEPVHVWCHALSLSLSLCIQRLLNW